MPDQIPLVAYSTAVIHLSNRSHETAFCLLNGAATSDSLAGKKIQKQLPLRPAPVVERTVIRPWCLLTIPKLSHKPSPDPFSSFVV
jgi:hypothetical protein